MTDVTFGIWDHFERRPEVPVARQYQDKIALLQQAEQLGFHAYQVAEHHLTSLDLAPSPNVFLAALAQATTRLRLGTMVSVAPLYHPVRLAQEICMLDHLSGGRLELGVGRGIRPIEHAWYELDAEQSRSRCEETLSILTSALSSGVFNHQGRHYQIKDARLDVLPLQRPYPPLWYAGGVEFAGSRGLNFLGRGQQQMRRYWELWEQTRHDPNRYNPGQAIPKAGIMHHIMLAPTEAKAMQIARRAWPHYVRNFRSTPVGPPPQIPGAPATQRIPGPQDFDTELKNDLRIIGTPGRVKDFLGRFLDELGPRPSFYFAGAFQWGDITPDEALESMQIFAEDVMPMFASSTANAPTLQGAAQ